MSDSRPASGSRCSSGRSRADRQLVGIFAGASLLFLAGLIDDLRTLPPLAKLAAQLASAAIVLSTGTGVQLVHRPWIAIPIGVVWLVGMTNAFNLLDNMDGLAGSLAVISAVFFACRSRSSTGRASCSSSRSRSRWRSSASCRSTSVRAGGRSRGWATAARS